MANNKSTNQFKAFRAIGEGKAASNMNLQKMSSEESQELMQNVMNRINEKMSKMNGKMGNALPNVSGDVAGVNMDKLMSNTPSVETTTENGRMQVKVNGQTVVDLDLNEMMDR